MLYEINFGITDLVNIFVEVPVLVQETRIAQSLYSLTQVLEDAFFFIVRVPDLGSRPASYTVNTGGFLPNGEYIVTRS